MANYWEKDHIKHPLHRPGCGRPGGTAHYRRKTVHFSGQRRFRQSNEDSSGTGADSGDRQKVTSVRATKTHESKYLKASGFWPTSLASSWNFGAIFTARTLCALGSDGTIKP